MSDRKQDPKLPDKTTAACSCLGGGHCIYLDGKKIAAAINRRMYYGPKRTGAED